MMEDILSTALDTVGELLEDVEFSIDNGFYTVRDNQEDTEVSVTEAIFMERTRHLVDENYDAIDAINLFQIGVLGTVVYG